MTDDDLTLVYAAAERFWSHVDRSGGPDACWPWTGAPNDDGYGKIRCGRRKWFVHRVSFVLAHGPIPDGQRVCHNCPDGDTPACCNPAHLWLGTQADNIADMISKGRDRKVRGDAHWTRTHPERLPRGANSPRAVLTEEQVRTIRARYAAGGISQPQLAALYGVTHPAIGYIVRGKTWRHLL